MREEEGLIDLAEVLGKECDRALPAVLGELKAVRELHRSVGLVGLDGLHAVGDRGVELLGGALDLLLHRLVVHAAVHIGDALALELLERGVDGLRARGVGARDGRDTANEGEGARERGKESWQPGSGWAHRASNRTGSASRRSGRIRPNYAPTVGVGTGAHHIRPCRRRPIRGGRGTQGRGRACAART